MANRVATVAADVFVAKHVCIIDPGRRFTIQSGCVVLMLAKITKTTVQLVLVREDRVERYQVLTQWGGGKGVSASKGTKMQQPGK